MEMAFLDKLMSGSTNELLDLIYVIQNLPDVWSLCSLVGTDHKLMGDSPLYIFLTISLRSSRNLTVTMKGIQNGVV